MKRGPMEEPEAFRRLQKLASEKNRKLDEIARMIVVAEEAVLPAPETKARKKLE
jgi:AmiR/NasT family two-component response regulator